MRIFHFRYHLPEAGPLFDPAGEVRLSRRTRLRRIYTGCYPHSHDEVFLHERPDPLPRPRGLRDRPPPGGVSVPRHAGRGPGICPAAGPGRRAAAEHGVPRHARHREDDGGACDGADGLYEVLRAGAEAGGYPVATRQRRKGQGRTWEIVVRDGVAGQHTGLYFHTFTSIRHPSTGVGN